MNAPYGLGRAESDAWGVLGAERFRHCRCRGLCRRCHSATPDGGLFFLGPRPRLNVIATRSGGWPVRGVSLEAALHRNPRNHNTFLDRVEVRSFDECGWTDTDRNFEILYNHLEHDVARMELDRAAFPASTPFRILDVHGAAGFVLLIAHVNGCRRKKVFHIRIPNDLETPPIKSEVNWLKWNLIQLRWKITGSWRRHPRPSRFWGERED
jgi:hypothetical protein